MNKYFITIESKEFNTIERKWENRKFSGEFQGKNERIAKIAAKDIYATEFNTEPSEIKIIKCEQFIEIKNSRQFHEICEAQKAIELPTRTEVKKIVDEYNSNNKPYTIFSLQYEDGWYITYGIKWANNIGYYVLEGNFTLPNDIDF